MREFCARLMAVRLDMVVMLLGMLPTRFIPASVRFLSSIQAVHTRCIAN